MARTTAGLRLACLLLAALATTSASAGRGRYFVSSLGGPSSAAVRRPLAKTERRRRLVQDLPEKVPSQLEQPSGLPAGTGTVATASASSSSALAAAAPRRARSSAVLAALGSVPRGGARALIDECDEDDDESGFVVQKLRNLVRSLLDVFDRSSPTLASIVRSFFGMVEGFTGARLLPREKKGRKAKSRTRKGKRTAVAADEEAAAGKSKRRRKRAAAIAEEEESDGEDEAPAPRKKKAAAGAKKRSSSGGGSAAKRKQPASAGGGGQATMHASKSLKSNNPNYRIQRELKEFLSNPPPNLRVSVGRNIRVWIIHVTGTEGSIYEGERYKLRVSFPPDYPTGPPSVYFLQPTPRHEHVYTNGDICLSLLGKDWRPTMTAQSLANSILSILSGAQRKSLPMDNARHAPNKPGGRQDDWIYHDDNC